MRDKQKTTFERNNDVYLFDTKFNKIKNRQK